MRDEPSRPHREWSPPAGFGPLVVVVAWVLTVFALAALALLT
jgi:hypothetical protein